VNPPAGPDLLILDEDHEYVGIEVLGVRGRDPLRSSLHRVRDIAYRGHWLREKFTLTVFAIAIVAHDEEAAKRIIRFFESRDFDLPPVHLHVGFLDVDGIFTEVSEIRI
jgi:hypothetical protein